MQERLEVRLVKYARMRQELAKGGYLLPTQTALFFPEYSPESILAMEEQHAQRYKANPIGFLDDELEKINNLLDFLEPEEKGERWIRQFEQVTKLAYFICNKIDYLMERTKKRPFRIRGKNGSIRELVIDEFNFRYKLARTILSRRAYESSTELPAYNPDAIDKKEMGKDIAAMKSKPKLEFLEDIKATSEELKGP